MTVTEIFTHKYFASVGVPLIFVLFGVMTNLMSRRDNDKTPFRNEFAVGTQITLMSISMVIGEMYAASNNNSVDLAYFAGSFAWFLMPFAICVVNDRFISWHQPDGEDTPHKRKFIAGIISPNLMAIAFFIYWRLS